MSYPDLPDLTPQPSLILLWLLLFTSILTACSFGPDLPKRAQSQHRHLRVWSVRQPSWFSNLLLSKVEVLSLPSLQNHTVPLCLSPAVISRKGNVAQKHILLCQFSDLNNETEEVLHGVNTPWNLSSFWSCLSHLWSHLSPQVPISFVVWIELFLVNWIPCLQLLIPFHPSSVLLSYASSLAEACLPPKSVSSSLL